MCKRLIVLALLGISIGLGITFALYKFQEPQGTVYKETSTTVRGYIGVRTIEKKRRAQ